MSTDIDIPNSLAAPVQQADQSTGPRMTVLEPVRGWQPINFRELWQYRELLFFLTWRDVKVRYKQTLLGMAWAVIQPAMLMIVFTIFRSHVAHAEATEIPDPLFVYLGVLPWSFFATAISNSGNSVVNSERLVTKVYFPRLAIPIASAGASIVDFLIAFTLLAGMMVYYGVMPGPAAALIPVVFLILFLTALGVGTMLAALNVLYRDFRYVIPFMMQVWMLGTPTVYTRLEGPMVGWKALVYVNPLTGLIATFRDACIGREVDYHQLMISAGIAVALFICGCWCFRRFERRFADLI